MKVYLTSSGSYSDYSVNGVFSTREKAETWERVCHGESKHSDANGIEEMELDHGLSEMERGLRIFGIQMRRRGDVIAATEGGYPSIVDSDVYWSKWNPIRKPAPAYTFAMPEEMPDREDWHCTFYVWATDKDHAVKVANERRIMALAAEQPATAEGKRP